MWRWSFREEFVPMINKCDNDGGESEAPDADDVQGLGNSLDLDEERHQ